MLFGAIARRSEYGDESSLMKMIFASDLHRHSDHHHDARGHVYARARHALHQFN